MKGFFKKYIWWIIGGADVFLALIPLLINHLFQQPAQIKVFDAEWYASDALSFYGTLLSAILAIAGVYWSIDHAQRNYRNDEINRVKPYFALNHYMVKSKRNLLSSNNETDNKLSEAKSDSYYEEYKLEKIYICITNDGIKFKTGLTESELQNIRNQGLGWKTNAPGVYSLCYQDLLSHPFEVENVGSGAALNTKVAFYKAGDSRRATHFHTVKVGTSIYIHIYSVLPSESLIGTYNIELLYEDILGNSYSQKYPLEVFIDTETNKMKYRIDLTGTQKIVKEENI